MSIARDIFCFSILLTMLFATVFYVATGVSGCWCTLSARAILMYVAFRQFSNNPPNSASMAHAITLLIMMHSSCIGLFYRSISCSGVLDFGPRKKYHLALIRASGSDM